MFMPVIDHLVPVNFLCSKCLSASGIEGGIIGRKSSLKHIKEDMRANEIIICEEKWRGYLLSVSKAKRRYRYYKSFKIVILGSPQQNSREPKKRQSLGIRV